MHTMRFLRLLIVTLAVLVAGCRTAPEPVGVQTGPAIRAPFVYLIDYDTGRHFVNDPGSIAAFAEAPPDLVHVGKCVPILHNWGAVPLKVGENQFTGGPGHTLDRSAIRLLKPQELEERIRWLKQFTADWHATGVPLLMPYSSIHTIAGDHQTREGFWHFYDHWDDYAKWLGPRPKEDPFKWLMVDQKGKFVPGACGGYSPDYYAPLHRYRVCPSRPEWRRFQSSLTRLIAEVGYDGVFVDNSGPRNVCFCELCKSGFKGYVQALPASQRSRMGLPPGKTDYELDGEDTPAELIRRYRIASYVDYLRTINAAGRAVNERFMVFPNVGRFGDFMPMSEACQFYMFETSGTAGCLTGFPPPEDAELTIRATSVATKANLISYHHELSDRERFVEMIATVKCPTHVQVGRTAELACEIAVLGAT